jgi:hypothetical protein
MPQKPWVAKHKPLMFFLDRMLFCRSTSSSSPLELDEVQQELESMSLTPVTIARSIFFWWPPLFLGLHSDLFLLL